MIAGLMETLPGSPCGASGVPSVCLCCVMNIKSPKSVEEWNEFALAWRLVMEVISKDTKQHGDKMQMVMFAD